MVRRRSDTPYGFGEERVLRTRGTRATGSVGCPGRGCRGRRPARPGRIACFGRARRQADDLAAAEHARRLARGPRSASSESPRSQIRSVSVTGQSSGVHSGRLLSYSAHRGASFVPDQPLTQGESVAVVVRIRGRKPIRFGFTVATLGAKLGPLDADVHPARQAPALRHRAGSDCRRRSRSTRARSGPAGTARSCSRRSPRRSSTRRATTP